MEVGFESSDVFVGVGLGVPIGVWDFGVGRIKEGAVGGRLGGGWGGLGLCAIAQW